MKYRMLKKGELIEPDDEVKSHVDGKWYRSQCGDENAWRVGEQPDSSYHRLSYCLKYRRVIKA